MLATDILIFLCAHPPVKRRRGIYISQCKLIMCKRDRVCFGKYVHYLFADLDEPYTMYVQLNICPL